MSLQKVKLDRSLGLGSAAAMVAGSAIGSGVFLVAADISRQLPSPAMALAAWVAAALVSLLGALAFAELGAMFPGPGGQYVYLSEAFGPLPGFLYGWTLALVIQPGSIAAVAIAFAQYFSGVLPMDATQIKVMGSAAILITTIVNLIGVRRGAGLQNLLTAIKVLALIGIGVAAFFMSTQPGAGIGNISGLQASAFGVALIAAFWAFDGWNNVTFVAGEIKDPRRNVPWSLFIGVAGIGLLYFIVNLAYYRMLPAGLIASSNFPAADVARVMGGSWAVHAVIITVILSTLGCVNGMVLAGARVTYAMAENKELPSLFAYLHPRYRVPSITLLVQMVWSILLVWSGRYDQLFTYVVSAAFIFYGLTAAGLIVLRIKRPNAERPYKTLAYPYLPILYILFTIAFVVNAIYEKPLESLAGLVLVLLGIPAYYALKKRKTTS